MADSWLTEGDTAPSLISTLRDRDGNPVDIANATVEIRFRSMTTEDIYLVDDADNDQVGNGSDGSKGNVSYEFTEPFERDGYWYDWRVTYNGGEIETFPNDGPLTLAVPFDIGEGLAS